MPQDVFKFVLHESINQMAPDEKVYIILKDEYIRSMKTNGWDEKRIGLQIQLLDEQVVDSKKSINEQTRLFKPNHPSANVYFEDVKKLPTNMDMKR